MTSHDRPLQGQLLDWRRSISGQVAMGWLLAEGLRSSLAQVGWHPTSGSARAPGLDDLVAELAFLASASTSALDEALDQAWSAQAPQGSDLALEPPTELEREARLSIVAAATVRRVAQAALGATSCMSGAPEVVRVERAAVELLAFGSASSATVPLHRDGLRLYGSDEEDLVSEVAGIGARLLCDWGGGVTLGTSDGRSLEIRARGDQLVVRRSWAHEDPARWDSPVKLSLFGSKVRDILHDELGTSCGRGLVVTTSA